MTASPASTAPAATHEAIPTQSPGVTAARAATMTTAAPAPEMPRPVFKYTVP